MKQLNKYYSLEEALASVGKGWAPLIHRVYNAKIGLGIPVGIIQVKEKWGGLRIYTDYYDSQLEQVIQEVGKESLTLCETCGISAQLVKVEGWFRTLCEQHRGEAVPVEN